jgi:DNA-3-methyladenine glycosylase
MEIPKTFFNRSAVLVAKELLGCTLVISQNGHEKRYIILETEAYEGPKDLASHASKGRTKRTEVMFGEPGCIYIYLIYGMYYMLNIVTGPKDHPAAVLIRSIEGVVGPGRVTKLLGIDKRFNEKELGIKTGIWIEFPKEKKKVKIVKTARIGVSYAGPVWSKKLYRFFISGTVKK